MPQRDYHTWTIDSDVADQLGAALGRAVYGPAPHDQPTRRFVM